jgi:hypothetical protein
VLLSALGADLTLVDTFRFRPGPLDLPILAFAGADDVQGRPTVWSVGARRPAARSASAPSLAATSSTRRAGWRWRARPPRIC